jgi:phosphoribosylanthranilate isomerase
VKIKICGLTSPAEAEYLNRNHVDYAGIVLFCEKSKRNMTIQTAKAVIEALSPEIKKVAVMVSPTAKQVAEAAAAGFDYVQIHGELDRQVLETSSLPILKAFNITDMDELSYYRSCQKIVGYVMDAQEPGSGKCFDWNLLKTLPRDGKLMLLAGGLNAENVAEAIAQVRPDGVDVSSGVEYADRKGKDPERVDTFVEQVRRTAEACAGGGI